MTREVRAVIYDRGVESEEQGVTGTVVSVGRSATHSFSKPRTPSIGLLAGFGVEGDAHAGELTQHRYLQKKAPHTPNLTQVHLIHEELFPYLADRGYEVGPGDLGENITTRGIDLLSLPVDTRLVIGSSLITVTGLRSPCTLINGFRKGLMKQLVGKDEAGTVIRRSGIMGVVTAGGDVKPGDLIRVELPSQPHVALGVV
jgi:MOSC domain-containing protein YiiM